MSKCHSFTLKASYGIALDGGPNDYLEYSDTLSFSYDTASRVTAESLDNGMETWAVSYGYDTAGNRPRAGLGGGQ